MEAVREREVEEQGKIYTFFVDDREFQVRQPVITGARIMEMAGIPVEVGLNVIEEDGTQRSVRPDEEIELKPGRRFKKAPRFKRG
jgi:multiubiquitin